MRQVGVGCRPARGRRARKCARACAARAARRARPARNAAPRECRAGQLRLVVGMNQIVRHAGMIGFGGKKLFQNGCSLFAVGEGLVVVRLGSEQRERAEHCRFVIVGIGLVHFLHRIGISFGARVVVEFVGVAIESGNRRDVRFLARRGGFSGPRPALCGGRLTEATLDDGGVGLIPELMPHAHGDSPMRHGAVGSLW